MKAGAPMNSKSAPSICVAAIVKGDERFIEEWLVYHRIIGVDRFLIYDNDPDLPMRSTLRPYESFVTVIDWPGDPTASWPGRNLQTRTYTHALVTAMSHHDWVTFIDVDEFIVLRQHESLPEFLASFEQFGSVRLNWHVFGHNGYYEDPPGLVTPVLTRRMARPSPRTKAISRPEAVSWIDSAHMCRLKSGWQTADANGRPYSDDLYPGKTDAAHINHYQCRSFLSWMGRLQRGDVSFNRSNVPAEHAWRFDPHLCLRKFVETVAWDRNELVDDYMMRYERPILDQLGPGFKDRLTAPHGPRTELADLQSTINGPAAIPGRQPWFPRISALFTRYFRRHRARLLLRRLLRDRASR